MQELALLFGKKKQAPIPVDENVVFLSHFNESPPENIVTTDKASLVNQGYYQTQMILNQPTESKFGPGFLKHGGSVGGGASEYYTFPKRFNFSNRDFTIESWHYWSPAFSGSGAYQYGWEIGLAASNECGLMFNGTRYNGTMSLGINRNSFNGQNAKTIDIPGLTSLPADKYFHFAVVRDKTQIRIYLNGKLAAVDDIGTGAITEGSLLRFGLSNNAYQPGCRTDEVRITMDQALYVGSSFSVPTGPFPDPVIED